MKLPIIENIAEKIEKIVWEQDVTYMDAAIMLADQMEIEVENIGTMIQSNANLTEKFRNEAENLHFLPRQNRLDA